MLIPVLVLALVFLIIAVRQVGSVRLRIWQIMLIGALIVLILGQISLASALASINVDVMLFLFGMFVVGYALEESGYISHLSYIIFRNAKSTDQVIIYILFGAGFASMFLMNDTLAIIGTPVALILAKKHGLNCKMLLLALAFGVTIGSVASPIGNPQNLLIALQVNGTAGNAFIEFGRYLIIPTLLNLLAAYVMLRAFYGEHFRACSIVQSALPIRDKHLAFLSRVSMSLVLVLVAAKVLLEMSGSVLDFKITYIALAAACPILILSRRRLEVLRGIDWQTLVFFASMFVLMGSVWESGFFQGIIADAHSNVTSVPMIMAVSVLVSQFISNVPLVALYLPILLSAGAKTGALMALAAGSTIAGNLSILGAASNVIIIQNAEKRTGDTITFWEFAKIGVPLSLLNVLVYWLFLV